MKSDLKILTFLTFLTIGIFFISNEYLGGYLSSSQIALGDEISAPSDSLYQWGLTQKSPFQYRLLFPTIVKGSWQLLPAMQQTNRSFVVVYKTWSVLFLVTAVLVFYMLARTVGFDRLWSLLGSLFFLLSPPILLAYTLPVHTREDTLAYTILCAGLICLLQNRMTALLILMVLGAFCRETLLLLPFLFVFFYHNRPLPFRIMLAAVPAVVWLSIRLLMEKTPYDPWEGLKWNLANVEQVIGFTYLAYGFMWFLFFYGLYHRQQLKERAQRTALMFFYRSGATVCSLIILTTLAGGIVNEIRLLFLMSPWLILISLHVLYRHREHMIALIHNKKYIAYLFLSPIVFGTVAVFLMRHYQQFMPSSMYAIRFDVWIAMTMFSLLLTALSMPFYYKILVKNDTAVGRYANHY